MESREHTEGFEDFLQEKADQYRLYPSDRVWNAINHKLHPRKKWSYLVVAAIFIGLGIGGSLHDSSLVKELVANGNFSEPDQTDQLAEAEQSNNTARVVPLRTTPRSSNLSPRVTANESNAEQLLPSALITTAEARVVPINNPESDLIASAIVSEAQQNAEAYLAPGETSSQAQDATRENSAQGGFESENEKASESISFNKTFATVPRNLDFNSNKLEIAALPAPEKASAIKVLKPRHLKIGWQLYASPTVSYRKLSGEGMTYYNTNNLSSVFRPDVEKSVRHKPALGFELGTALTFATGPNFRFKTGLQLNINRYDVQAFSYIPEVAPLTPGGIGHTTINAISRYRNYNGFALTWLQNKHIMMAIPLGAEVTLFGSEKVKFNIGGTLQPTFVLNNQAYMISTNMKNYAQEPSLYKKFNVAAGAEAYLSIKSGTYRWMIGPQFRYQIFSSYKQAYPISEHLTDYGFKIGISR